VYRVCGAVLALLAVSALPSCQSNALAPILFVQVALDSVRIDRFYTAPPSQGILAVSAQLSDKNRTLSTNERIAVEVSVNDNNDTETLSLDHKFCFLPDPYFCTLLTVQTKEGHSIDELNGFVMSIPARWWVVGPSRRNGGLRLVDVRSVEPTLRALSRHPAVQNAERDGLLVPGTQQVQHLPSQLLGALPLDYGPASINDGKVQGARGARITIRYTQSNGQVTTDTLTIP
jgi:hypothetical protein